MTRKYAESTDVPVTRTRVELEDLLSRYGATATAAFTSRDNAAVAFEMHDRKVVMKLQLPSPEAREFTHGRVNQSSAEVKISETAA
jgi:hypothetical protein